MRIIKKHSNLIQLLSTLVGSGMSWHWCDSKVTTMSQLSILAADVKAKCVLYQAMPIIYEFFY